MEIMENKLNEIEERGLMFVNTKTLTSNEAIEIIFPGFKEEREVKLVTPFEVEFKNQYLKNGIEKGKVIGFKIEKVDKIFSSLTVIVLQENGMAFYKRFQDMLAKENQAVIKGILNSVLEF